MNGMSWQEVNIVISLVTAASSFSLALYAVGSRQIKANLWFTALVFAVGWVSLCYGLEAAVGNDLGAYVTLSKFEYLGLTFIPLLWLVFALHFSGRDRLLTRSALAWLAVIPLITIGLAFTNDFHGLIWKQPLFKMVNGMPIYSPVYGVWFWVYTVYAYLIFLGGSLILLRRAFGEWSLYRSQAIFLLVGTTLPWIGNIIDIFDNLNPFPYLYLNEVFLEAGLLCFAFCLFRLRLLDITPLAYETVLNNIPDGLVVVDTHNRVVTLNKPARAYLDDTQQDPIGKLLPQVFSRYAAHFESLKGVAEFEGRIPIDDMIIEIRLSPVVDRQGKPKGRLFVLNDVTAQNHLEQAQREEKVFAEIMGNISSILTSTLDTDSLMRLILESIEILVSYSQANIMLIDDDGHTIRVRQHRGYSAEATDYLENTVFDVRTFPLFSKAAQAVEPTIVPDTRLDPDWVMFDKLKTTLSFATAPIRVDKQLTGFINIEHTRAGALTPDISNRLQIFALQVANAIKNTRLYEETLQQAEELKSRVKALTIAQQVYKEISFSFKTNNLMELALDAVLRLSQADGGFVALMKGDSLELTNYYGQYDPDRLAASLNTREGIIGQAIDNRAAVMKHQPEISWLEGAQAQIVLPLYAYEMDEPDLLHGIIVLETCRPAHFTEDRLQLLRLIADRAAVALENMRLVNTVQDHADELEMVYGRISQLEQLKSDMIRIAAHDLKNPLGAMLSYLQMLVEPGMYTVDAESVYPLMKQSAERMLQIINNFLSLERIERVAQQETMEPFDLCDVVTRTAHEFSERALQKSQALEVTKPESPCMVNGDLAQVYEAVTNLVGNAIKYTPDKGRVTIRLTNDERFANLEVRDTGYGIPADQQKFLFQPFYRTRTRETAGIEGTGLGLHLTKSIIERQGGTMIFSSVYGKGSTFGFRMPLIHSNNTQESNSTTG
jgi:signal transduction histidine kinase/PAS domain-containing protein